ncbi:MAG TPA: WG repeat-containing protein [Bryobacteraceae bacterium]|nr:WG repeat-containing protein [Bryobacteraceae bacterium]
MDRTGRVVIQPQFFDVGDFFDGLARVVVNVGKDYKSCFIDETGKTVIPCTFDAALNFSEGLAPVRVGRFWGYIDRTGRMAIQPQFQGAAEISDGLGRFMVWEKMQCSGRGYTKDDAPMYAFAMHDITFHLTSGCFAEHQRFGYVDKTGQIVIKPEFFVAEDFSEGLAAVRIEESATSKYAFVDKTGAIVIRPQFDQAYSFSEGLAAVETGFRAEGGKKVAGKWGFIDRLGKFVISPRFELTLGFSEGLARACENLGAWGFIDRTGGFVIAPNFNQALDFSEGLAGVWPDDGDFLYIDRTGKRVLKLKNGRWAFSDGLTVAGEYSKRVYVGRNGKTVAPYEVNPGY